MLRYVAFLWAGAEVAEGRVAQTLARKLRADSGWQITTSLPGLIVLTTGVRADSAELHPIGDGCGIVLGTLFERQDAADEAPARAAHLARPEAARIVASKGKRLVDAYWGSYVAFVRAEAVQTTHVVRAPMYAPPCMVIELNGLVVLCSSFADCLSLGLRSYSLNWPYIAAYLGLGRPQSRATGLNEVYEVSLGECVEFGATSRTSRQYWDPGRIAQQEPIEDAALAVAMLRATARACIHTWASLHERIVLRLSGGVDSSIVLACLSNAPSKPAVTALHHFWPGQLRSDERPFARTVAQHTASRLIEAQRNARESLRGILTSAPAAQPTGFVYRELFDTEAQLARANGASAIFCGTLGDALFHMAPAMPAASEFLQRRGIGRGFFKVAMDVAELERASFWRVSRLALRDGLSNRTKGPWTSYRCAGLTGQPGTVEEFGRLLTDDALAMYEPHLADYIHPWLRSVENVPLGKLPQIFLLPLDDYWRNPFARIDDPDEIPPFASQPLVELCLRIPTYLNIADGCDRAVARKAFRADLPDVVYRRRSKGSPDAWTRQIIATNAEFVKEMLLDGILVKEGLLDRRKLAAALPGELSTSQCPVGCITQHLCTEAWLRRCSAEVCKTMPRDQQAAVDNESLRRPWVSGPSFA
jgi:asparagine synthase (glutamine-hydrolysing)